jgi:hypothetical protein
VFDLDALVGTFAQHDVRYVLIGGVAMRFHAAAILTQDIDVAYEPEKENLRRLSDALSPFHPRLRGIRKHGPFKFDSRTLAAGMNFTLSTEIGDVDLFGSIPGFTSFQQLTDSSEDHKVGRRTVRVLGLKGLIDAKRASGRPKDMLVLPELEALLEAQQQSKSPQTRVRRRRPRLRGF